MDFEESRTPFVATQGTSPYVLYPAQSVHANPPWAAYKRIQHAFWTWEDFEAKLDRTELRKPTNHAIVAAAFDVVSSHLDYLNALPVMHALSTMCNAEQSAAVRSLYGVVIARSYLHLEVYSALAVALNDSDIKSSNTFDRSGQDKILELECQLSAPLTSYNPHATSIVYCFVFSLGVLATLHTTHFCTHDSCFTVWEHIFTDYAPFVQITVDRMEELDAATVKLLRTAYRVEEKVVLTMLPEFMHEHVQQLMKDMMNSMLPGIM